MFQQKLAAREGLRNAGNANSSPSPGNANLPIGVSSSSPTGAVNDAIQENGAPRWHSRGYLPHFESSDVIQHITFHLADSLPQTALLRLESELKFLPAEKRDSERRKRVDAWIDAGHGSCILRRPAIAAMVQGSLLAFDSQRYRLLAWVVMPNHVHALFQPMAGWTVAKLVAAWKKFTARKICDARRNTASGANANSFPGNANLPIGDSSSARIGALPNPNLPIAAAPTGPVWHREYWDRFIRDRTHLLQVIEYIHLNPVKAGLVSTPQSWPWSSAYPRER